MSQIVNDQFRSDSDGKKGQADSWMSRYRNLLLIIVLNVIFLAVIVHDVMMQSS